MRATPIVDIRPGKARSSNNDDTESSIGSQLTPVGFPTRMASSFKNDVIQSISTRNKVLCIKFEVLTKNELIDSLLNGCRVLQLTCNYVEQECLCVEGPYGAVARIPYEELQDIFSSKIAISSSSKIANIKGHPTTNTHHEGALGSPGKRGHIRATNAHIGVTNKQGAELGRHEEKSKEESGVVPGYAVTHLQQVESKLVDVIVLSVKNNRDLVDLFIKLKIPHIITFEFTSNEFDFRHKTYEDECLEHFCIYFYEELISQKSIADAYQIASNKAFDYLSEKYFEGKPRGYITQIIGRGPLLFPEEADHSEVLFRQGRFPLANGKLDDISTTRCPTNIEKMLIPFTGRNKELYGVSKKMCENPAFLKVTGPAGIGKTAFVLQLGYHMVSRNMFPDGIFYIPLKKLKSKQNSDYQMKDLLRETLGLDVQLGFLNFFKAKKMLLIFDDFDLLYKKEIEFQRLFFLTLKECKIACIVVTTASRATDNNGNKGPKKKQKALQAYSQMKKEIDDEILEKNTKWKLKGLGEEELVQMIQSFLNMSNKDAINIEDLKKCPQIKQAQGNPKFIVDKLLEGKFEVQRKIIKINPTYGQYLNFEDEYLTFTRSNSSISSLSILRRSSSHHHSEIKPVRRVHSAIGTEVSQQNALTSPKPTPRLLKENSFDEIFTLKKSKSQKNEKKSDKERLNKTFEATPKPLKKHERYKKSTKKAKRGKKLSENMLNQSIKSTGSLVEKNKRDMGSQTIIDEKLEDEKVETVESEDNAFDEHEEPNVKVQRVQSTKENLLNSTIENLPESASEMDSIVFEDKEGRFEEKGLEEEEDEEEEEKEHEEFTDNEDERFAYGEEGEEGEEDEHNFDIGYEEGEGGDEEKEDETDEEEKISFKHNNSIISDISLGDYFEEKMRKSKVQKKVSRGAGGGGGAHKTKKKNRARSKKTLRKPS